MVEKTISFEILPRKSVDWESYFVYFEIIRSLVRIQPSPQKEKEKLIYKIEDYENNYVNIEKF